MEQTYRWRCKTDFSAVHPSRSAGWYKLQILRCRFAQGQFFFEASITTARFFLPLQGFEHVPKDMRRTIIVVNHQSTLDVAALSVLRSLDFYVIFKSSLLWVPGMGSAMWLANYLPVNRTDRDSKKALLRRATDGLRSGDNQLWFPEGTRAQSTMMGEFKPGAFLVAQDAGADILPVTISGARRLMPAKGLPQLRPGHVIVTIHPVIKHDASRTVEQTIALARTSISTALRPEIDMPSAGAKAAATAAEGGVAGVTGSGAALVATGAPAAAGGAASAPVAGGASKKDD